MIFGAVLRAIILEARMVVARSISYHEVNYYEFETNQRDKHFRIIDQELVESGN